MIGELTAHLKSTPNARVNLWLGPDRCPGLHDVKGVGFQRSNWTEVCVGHLARENRFPAIVVQYDHPSLVRMLAAFEMLPPLIHHPKDQAASGDPLTLFLPAKLENSWAEKIAGAAGKHPWVIAGVNDPTREDCEVLERIASSGADIYWVAQWSNPVPLAVRFAVKKIAGHDPDTFFAALLHALGMFPLVASAPEKVGDDPAASLDHVLNIACDVFTVAADQLIASWPITSGSGALSDEDFRAQMERSQRLRPALVRLSGENPARKFIFGTFVAGTSAGGRRADEFFEWSWAAIQELPPGFLLMGFDSAEYRIKILLRRARLRTAAAAEPFYQEGQRIIRALDKPAHAAAANLCATWSELKPPQEANLLIEQAVDILRQGRRAGAPDLINAECKMLRDHARRLPASDAQRYLNAAKACAERYSQFGPQKPVEPQPFLNPDRIEGMREYHLGLIALDEVRLFPGRKGEYLEAANRYLQAILQNSQVNPAWVYMDWGVGLAMLEREPEQYAKAYELLRKSADTEDSEDLQANWSAMLLGEARQTGEPRRRDLLSEAERHARQAESLQSGKGRYSLARVSAQRRQVKDVMEHLRVCARYPTLPARTAFDVEPDFAEIRGENWFQELVHDIYPD